MAEHVKKSHNVSLLVYHLVCPVRFRRVVFTPPRSETFKEICLGIEKRYEITFLEVGTDKDHVHFLIQTVPNISPTEAVTTIKSVTAKQMFKRHPDVKTKLWDGNFWTSGYYVNTVGHYGNLDMLEDYVKNQGNEAYEQIHQSQATLFA